MKRTVPLWAAVAGGMILSSCGGGGGGENHAPQDKAPASLNGWALVVDQLDGGAVLNDIEALILSETSGLLSLNPGRNYTSGLGFRYQREDDSNRGQLVITETADDKLTITLNIVFDEYHVQEGGVGSTMIGHVENWSYVDEAGVNVSGTSGRVTGRLQQ